MKPVNQRVREHRQRMKDSLGGEVFKEMKRGRIEKIREKQKKQRLKNDEAKEEYCKKGRASKRLQQARKR